MRVLIAEDDQVLADGLMRALRSSGAAVDHVPDGSQADTALMTNTEFDLLILDLGLPKLHGLEVLKRLRARGSAMPVLILTAADSVEQRVKGLDLGADIVPPATGEPDTNAAVALVGALRERRILISASGRDNSSLKLRPPLPFSRADAERFITELDAALTE